MKLPFYRRKPATRTAARKFVAAGDRHRDARRWESARDMYSEALRLDGSLTHIWVQYGHALKESGEPKLALGAYQKAMELNSTVADTALQIAHCTKILGDLEQAKRWYLKALSLDAFEYRAERELQFLDVPVDLFIPDLEKRRLKLDPFSLTGRPFYFCAPVSPSGADERTDIRAGFVRKEFESFRHRTNIGLCEITRDGTFRVVHAAGHVVGQATDAGEGLPEGAVIVVALDSFIDVDGLGPLLMQAINDHKAVSALFVDKLASPAAAQLFLRELRNVYLAARSLTQLTIALDPISVDLLDRTAAAGSMLLSPVIGLGHGDASKTEPGNLQGPIIVIARDLRRREFANAVSVLQASSATFVVMDESSETPIAHHAVPVMSAYSKDGAIALASASLIVVMDDCIDANRWIIAAQTNGIPVVSGMVEPVSRIWGKAVLDFIDFSEPQSVLRLARIVDQLKPRDQSSKVPEAPKASADEHGWQDIFSHSWVGHDGFPTIRTGRLYAFKGSNCLSFDTEIPSADRFRYGSSWLDYRQRRDDIATEWALAGRVANRDAKAGAIMRVLVTNDEDSDVSLSWTSPAGQQEQILQPGQRSWLNIKAKAVQDTQAGIYRFGWTSDKSRVRPLAFVVTADDQDQFWAGFWIDRSGGNTLIFSRSATEVRLLGRTAYNR